MAPSSSLSLSVASSSFSQSWEHDVFPSFHGPDVRKAFLSHVLKEFRSKGIYPFIDNEIKRGESIGPELKRAIRGSKIAIVLLSKNYASSSWCLDELVEVKNVLLVLDHVGRLAQLDALAKKLQWFGPRSRRIIITTEDLKLLKAHGINHIYKVDFPSTDEALQMFCMYAFDQKSPKDGFTRLSHQVTYLAGELLPLGLKVMGETGCSSG